jgi:hypothetical protein
MASDCEALPLRKLHVFHKVVVLERCASFTFSGCDWCLTLKLSWLLALGLFVETFTVHTMDYVSFGRLSESDFAAEVLSTVVLCSVWHTLLGKPHQPVLSHLGWAQPRAASGHP